MENKAFFPVKAYQLHANLQDIGHKALFNGATDTFMSIVSDRYKLITHEFVADLSREVIEGLSNTQVDYDIKTCHTGAKLFYKADMRGMRFDLLRDSTSNTYEKDRGSDPAWPVITALNSYDGTLPIALRYGIKVEWCSNGATTMKKLRAFRFLHKGRQLKQQLIQMRLDVEEDLRSLISTTKAGAAKLNREPCTEYLALLLKSTLADKYIREVLNQMTLQGADFSYKIEGKKLKRETIQSFKLNQLSAYALWQIVTNVITHRMKRITAQESASAVAANIFFKD